MGYKSSVDFLAQQKNSIIAFKASGSGRAEFIGKNGKRDMEAITRIDIIFDTPNKLYVSMDHLLQKSAVSMGLTGYEFWTWSRFKGRNDIFWGTQDMLVMDSRLPIAMRPESFLECLGYVNYTAEEDLFVSDDYSIGMRNENGKMVKTLSFSHSDFTLQKIGYFNDDESLIMLCELSDYKPIDPGSSYLLPHRIHLYHKVNNVDVYIKIKRVKPIDTSEKKYSRPFNLPPKERADNVYFLTESGNFIEER